MAPHAAFLASTLQLLYLAFVVSLPPGFAQTLTVPEKNGPHKRHCQRREAAR
jgi:hypothetical protein